MPINDIYNAIENGEIEKVKYFIAIEGIDINYRESRYVRKSNILFLLIYS